MTRSRKDPRKARLATVLAALLVLVLAGCGGAPSEQLSPLSVRLAQIDAAVAAERFDQARRDLTALAVQTKAARAEGELSSSGADAILEAIIALRAALPAPTPTPTPTATPTASPTAPQPDPSPGGGGKGPGKGKGGDKGKGR